MIFLVSLIGCIVILIIRIIYVLRFQGGRSPSKSCAKTLIVIGSGGHTSEMTRLVLKLNPRLYQPRLYVLADSDKSSEIKIRELESQLEKITATEFELKKVPRSRKVGQSYVTSVFTTFYSVLACFPVVFSFRPDLILCNGPGTCIPVCLIGFLMRILFISNTRIVFIESVCRVKTLSLSGKILMRFADKVLVQWSELQKKYPKTEYIGRLV